MTIPWLDYFFMTTFASYFLWQGFKHYRHHYLVTFLIFFYIFAYFTTSLAVNTVPADEAFVKFTKVLALAFFIFSMLNTERRMITFLKVFVISIGFYGLKGGIFTVLTGGGYHVVGPPLSFFEDNNAMALTILMAFPFMVFFITHAESVYQRYFSIFCALSSAIAILGTQSRTGFVALVMTFLYYSWHLKKLGKTLMFLIPIGIAGAIVMADSWAERMSSTTNLETDASFQGRVDMWIASVKIANDKPFTGGGFEVIYAPSTIAQYMPADVVPRAIHSSYFQMIAEHGYLGFVLFMLMIYLTFNTAQKIAKSNAKGINSQKVFELTIAFRASIFGYMLMSLTLNMAFFDILYFLLAIIAIADLTYRKTQPTTSKMNISNTLSMPHKA